MLPCTLVRQEKKFADQNFIQYDIHSNEPAENPEELLARARALLPPEHAERPLKLEKSHVTFAFWRKPTADELGCNDQRDQYKLVEDVLGDRNKEFEAQISITPVYRTFVHHVGINHVVMYDVECQELAMLHDRLVRDSVMPPNPNYTYQTNSFIPTLHRTVVKFFVPS